LAHELLHVFTDSIYFLDENIQYGEGTPTGFIVLFGSSVHLLDELVDDLGRVLIRNDMGVFLNELDGF